MFQRISSYPCQFHGLLLFIIFVSSLSEQFMTLIGSRSLIVFDHCGFLVNYSVDALWLVLLLSYVDVFSG